MVNIDDVVGANARDFRKLNGLSQREVAERMTELGAGWVQSTVAKVEAGSRPMRVDELVALAQVLGMDSPNELLIPRRGRESLIADARSWVAEARSAVAEAEGRVSEAKQRLTLAEHKRVEAVLVLEDARRLLADLGAAEDEEGTDG